MRVFPVFFFLIFFTSSFSAELDPGHGEYIGYFRNALKKFDTIAKTQSDKEF